MALPALLLPLAGGATALVAGGAKLNAVLAEKRVDEIKGRIDQVNKRIESEKSRYSKLRMEVRGQFECQLNQYRMELSELNSRFPPPQDGWQPEPWLKQRLAAFIVRPKLLGSEPRLEEPVAAMRSASQVFQQGFRIEKTNPSLGRGLEVAAMAAAAAAYINSQLEYATRANKFVAEAIVYANACEKTLQEFDRRLAADIAEDRSCAIAMSAFVEDLKTQLSKDSTSTSAAENLRFAYQGAVELFLGIVDRHLES